MVGTVKNTVLKMTERNLKQWDTVLPAVIAGYKRRPLRSGLSPLELMYRVTPRMGELRLPDGGTHTVQSRTVEIRTMQSKRSECTVPSLPQPSALFVTGDLVLLHNKEKLALTHFKLLNLYEQVLTRLSVPPIIATNCSLVQEAKRTSFFTHSV